MGIEKMFKFIVTASCLAATALGAPQTPLVGAPLLRHAPNCRIEQEVIAVQQCTPRTEQVCNTIDVEHQNIEYEQICKEVTSTHCPSVPAHLIKREADAEADPQWFGAGYPFNYPRAVVAPTAVAAPVVAPTVATVKHACHEVTTVHCVPAEQTVPKTVCDPVETKHIAHHPFAYGF